jgi:Ca2+/H+ antiporter
MFEGTIYMIPSIVTAPIVTHPLAVIMNVWNLWMPLEIAEIALIAAPLVSAPLLSGALIRLTLVGSTLFWRALLDGSLPLFGPSLLWSSLRRSRSTRRNISTANATLATLIPAVTPAIIPTALSAVPLLRKAVKRHAQRQHGEK